MVYLLFFLSGAAGLIYEISWARQIGLLFGHTVHAAAVVLAAYFAGMALGYWLAAALSARLARPLRGYAVAELSVAAWAIVTPLVLELLELAPLAALLSGGSPVVQTGVRAGTAFLVLLPATVALGSTLPFVAEHVSPAGAPASRRIVLAYATNTLGAVTGVALATFVLILWLGVTRSSYVAAGVSTACGLVALRLAARTGGAHGRSEDEVGGRASPGGKGASATHYWLAALSGVGMLGLQVLYVRVFALVFHNSTYTFGGIVAGFLVALALGSALVAGPGRRVPPLEGISLACATGAVFILLTVALLQVTTQLAYVDAAGGFAGYLLVTFGLILLVVLVPVALLGGILPYTWLAVGREGASTGAAVGRLTGANTVAAAVGALVTSFFLLPLLGIWRCFALYSLLYAATGVVLLVRSTGLRRAVAPALAVLVTVAALAAVVDWRGAVATTRAGYEHLYQRDTAYGRIEVVKETRSGKLWMRQNRHYTLGTSFGLQSELRQGFLPLLLHPAPRRVSFLGLATGITASAALLDARVERVTAVELIPEVVQAARLFEAFNAGVLARPHAEIVLNDARHYLYATGKRFDVIVSDLFVPWHSQTGYLYTVEHYRAARSRLAPDGMFCQWLPLYQLGPRELELIADSFASVFPHTALWWADRGATSAVLGLIGSERPVVATASAINLRMGSIMEPPTGSGRPFRSGEDVMRLYVGDWTVRHPGYLNTDEHPRVEFLAPMAQRNKELLRGKGLENYKNAVLNALPRNSAGALPYGEARQAGGSDGPGTGSPAPRTTRASDQSRTRLIPAVTPARSPRSGRHEAEFADALAVTVEIRRETDALMPWVPLATPIAPAGTWMPQTTWSSTSAPSDPMNSILAPTLEASE